MKRIFLFLALILTADFCRATTNHFFENGIAAADAGNFSEAAGDFENSVSQNASSGALLDLGICEWQRGRAGAAILAWERARWIDPFDARASQNLDFAREVAQLDAPELRWDEKISTVLPSDFWIWICGASLWLAFGALILPRVLRWRKNGAQQLFAASCFFIFIVSASANFGEAGRAQIGFVLKKNAPLLLTPTRAGEVISFLNSGEAARKIRTRGSYFFIRTESGAGWIARENFSTIGK